MKNPQASVAIPHRVLPVRRLSRDTIDVTGDLLPAFDFVAVLLSAGLASWIYLHWITDDPALISIWHNGARAALAAAVLAPLLMCDRRYVALARNGRRIAAMNCYAFRFLVWVASVALLTRLSASMSTLPTGWLYLWLLLSLLSTGLLRLLMMWQLWRLERSGVLIETVAIVGAGPVADRLVRHLQTSTGNPICVVGIYDDRRARHQQFERGVDGTVAELIDLGTRHRLDWILITLPDAAEARVQQLVYRLKALSTPVGWCPAVFGAIGANRLDPSSATLLRLSAAPETARSLRQHAAAAADAVLPIWIPRLLAATFRAGRDARGGRAGRASPLPPPDCVLDDHDLASFTAVARDYGQRRYGYVVTPNADHFIRWYRQASFRALYRDAAFVLLDSRFVSHLVALTARRRLPVCTGSDLTAAVLSLVDADDSLVLVGGSAAQADALRQRYGLRRLAHHQPPMGFIHDPAAVEACLAFVEAHSPFRYCLLAVGSPQQEQIAQRLGHRAGVRGLALCIGASINFLTGQERRAPRWMQRLGLEWCYRLWRAPRRMAARYLVRGPQIFAVLWRCRLVLRRSTSVGSMLERTR